MYVHAKNKYTLNFKAKSRKVICRIHNIIAVNRNSLIEMENVCESPEDATFYILLLSILKKKSLESESGITTEKKNRFKP